MGLEHHQVVVGTGQIARSFQSLIDGMDQPIGNPAALLQYLLAKEVSQSAAVAFCGDGSVELLGEECWRDWRGIYALHDAFSGFRAQRVR